MMQRLKTFKVLFVLASILLIAKPFLGFKIFGRSGNPVHANTILVKVFAKRKPEDLLDAEGQASAMHQFLLNAGHHIAPSILLLLSLILPALLILRKLTAATIQQLHYKLLPPGQPYLLAGKLII